MTGQPRAIEFMDTGTLDEGKWWDSPYILGFTALGIAAILTIIFF